MNRVPAYFATRFPVGVFAPAIAIHAALAWWASGAGWHALVWMVALSAALIVQFRLWDDLEDVERDRLEHPTRVLTSASLRPFRLVLAGVVVASGFALGGKAASLAGYAALCLGLWGAYRVVRPRIHDRFWRYGVLLLKYPVIVMLIALAYGASSPGPLLAAAVCSYTMVCAYEAWHQGRAGRSIAGVKSPVAGLKSHITYPIAKTDSRFETVPCLACGATSATFFIAAEDDLTGKPGRFTFSTCTACGLVYQQPRLTLEHIRPYYDGDYIAHQPAGRWGLLAPLFRRAMGTLDRAKLAIVRRYAAVGPATRLLDVGCGSGAFLAHVGRTTGAQLAGVDFVDLSHRDEFRRVEFHHGVLYEQPVGRERFDVVTMWHFLEHDYDPHRSLERAWEALRPGGLLLVEVPRLDSLSFRLFRSRWPGLQAPQHTALYDRAHLVSLVKSAGFEVVEHLPYGAFPPYFYLFCGVAFVLLKGRGLNLRRAMVVYFAGQLLLLPLLPILQRLNFAMQTVVCRRPLT